MHAHARAAGGLELASAIDDDGMSVHAGGTLHPDNHWGGSISSRITTAANSTM